MLRFLQIRDYAIVDSLDLDFAPGFSCITGETGAGKSILVGALGLLCGERADTAAIRSGADKAELSAEFLLADDDPALEWLNTAELADGKTCLLRRVIASSGRSRAWVNGTVVTVQQLAELGALLVELHGQNEHIRLVNREETFRLLDSGVPEKELQELRDAFAGWRALDAEKRALLEERPLDAADRELLRYQVQELENAMLPAAEFAEIEAEHRMLTRGREVCDALQSAERTITADSAGANRSLHRAAEDLRRYAALDREIAAAADLLREAAINCDEAINSIQSALSRMDLSPERLERLERQLGMQHDLARKHRAEPEQLQEVLDRLRARLERSGDLERRMADAEKALEAALQEFRKAAAALHARRVERAGQLSSAVTGLMQELDMAGGRFEIEVHFDPRQAPAARGSDRIELLVSANPGTAPGPLSKIASGGELSRISLAIKVASKSGTTATQVFDEVDAGIGGTTAHAVGALIRNLAEGGQALCVTHLAQVAVFADQQIQVRKTSDGQGTRVQTALLGEAERVDEIARMLGGRLSAQSRAHAHELLAGPASHATRQRLGRT